MNRFFLYLAACLFPFWIQAQQTCFTQTDFEPGFVAIVTQPETQLHTWYMDLLGMELIKEFSSGDHTGKILKRGPLYVEILSYKTAVSCTGGPFRGIKKTGIFINTPVQEIKSCLLQNGVQAGRIFHDREMGFYLLHLVDPEGNELELLSKA